MKVACSCASATAKSGGERSLTLGETALVQSVFGNAIDCTRVRIKRRRWFAFQPRNIVMAPCGHVHFHPRSPFYRDDFAPAPLALQGLFIHEMTHVWQTQTHGWWYLLLVRPFSRLYDYALVPGRALADYGIEQQAEIVRHAFMLCLDQADVSADDATEYKRLLHEIAMA